MVDVREKSGALAPRMGLAANPGGGASGAEIMRPYAEVARAVGDLGETAEIAAVPLAEAAGSKAVEMDADGNVSVNWNWGTWTRLGRAHNAAARQAAIARQNDKIDTDIQEIRNKHPNDPQTFKKEADAYARGLKKIDPLLGGYFTTQATSVAGQHFRGIVSDNKRRDEQRLANDFKAREDHLETKSVFEKDRLGHGQRRMRVAVAAMVMRVSATVVSCS